MYSDSAFGLPTAVLGAVYAALPPGAKLAEQRFILVGRRGRGERERPGAMQQSACLFHGLPSWPASPLHMGTLGTPSGFLPCPGGQDAATNRHQAVIAGPVAPADTAAHFTLLLPCRWARRRG